MARGGISRQKHHHDLEKSSGHSRARGRGGSKPGADDRRHGQAHYENEDTRIGQIVSPSYKRVQVDPETLSYFSEIFALISEGKSVSADPTEKTALAVNILEETRGKELPLACHTGCGRVLENVLMSCDIIHTLAFLNDCVNVLPLMSMDPSGSHVVQAAMRSISTALLQHDKHATWIKTLETTLLKVSQAFGEKAIELMSSRYGSHVLRDLISILSGAPVDAPSNPLTSKSQIQGRLTVKAVSKCMPQWRHQAFPELLKSLATTIVEACRQKIVALRADSAAGPVLQAILKTLSGDEEILSFAISIILGGGEGITRSEGKVFEDAKFEEVTGMMKDQTSSHLMEVILQTAPDALYVEIFQRFFRHHLLQLSLHRYANFAVQALISSTRHQGQVNMVLDELEESFSLLIEERRAGVISSILATCGRFRTRRREACRAIAHAINPGASAVNVLIPHMLFLEDLGFSRKNAKHWEPEFGKKMSVLGCAMLQMIFSFPQDCSQQFSTSFAALEADQVVGTVKDICGSHVMEAFISSSVPMKHKYRSIAKLKGHFGELAIHPVSSYTVEKCYSIGDINLKEAITREVVAVQDELARSKHGPYLLKRCDVSGYAKSPEQWRLRQRSKQGNIEAFNKLFNAETTTEMAHENFTCAPRDALESARKNIKQENEEYASMDNGKVVQLHKSQKYKQSQTDERHVKRGSEGCGELHLIFSDSKQTEPTSTSKVSTDDTRPKITEGKGQRKRKHAQHLEELKSKVLDPISGYTLQQPAGVSEEKKKKMKKKKNAKNKKVMDE